jgi:hypothetical protein
MTHAIATVAYLLGIASSLLVRKVAMRRPERANGTTWWDL